MREESDTPVDTDISLPVAQATHDSATIDLRDGRMGARNNKVLAAVVGTAVAAVIGVGGFLAPANAYPPGTHVTVTASSAHTHHHRVVFTTTVAQGKPNAKVRVTVYDRKGRKVGEQVGRLNPDGTITFSWSLKGHDIKTLKIVAVVLSRSNFEKATTTLVIKGHHVTTPLKVREHKPFPVSVTGFPKNSPITITAVRGKKKVTVTGTTDADGKFTGTLTLHSEGEWAVIATSAGHDATWKVKVVD